MKIINLMENTEGQCGFYAEHGLSIYVETKNHKLLVDTGASEKTWENARKLGIDLGAIDNLILSHGHYDHSGGILSFAKVNSHAKIYMHSLAGEDYYSFSGRIESRGPRYIGIDKEILKLPQVIFTNEDLLIDDEISLFSNVTGRKMWPASNKTLKKMEKDVLIQDTFAHEQYVVISCEGKKILISGCAHNGILNILDRFRDIYHCDPDYVISGFHMMKKTEHNAEETKMIQDIATALSKMKTIFYSGHCTGLPAFNLMKEIMGEQLHYMHSGDRII